MLVADPDPFETPAGQRAPAAPSTTGDAQPTGPMVMFEDGVDALGRPYSALLKTPQPTVSAAHAQHGAPIVVTLPYPPSANRYWRSRVIVPKGKEPIVNTYVSSEAKGYKESVGWMLKAAGVRQPLQGRVAVHIELWPHRPLDWKTRAKKDPLFWADTVQRLDLDNARKVVTDALIGIAITDDKCIWKDSGEVMEPDGREACVVVTITPLVKAVVQEGLTL